MPSPAHHARAVGRSGINVVMERIEQWDRPVLALHTGAPDTSPPDHVLAAYHRAIEEGHTGYAPNRGLPQLVQAITTKLNTVNGIPARPEQVVVTAGATQGLHLALAAVLAPGEEVLVPDPGWPNYALTVRMLGARPVAYPLLPDNGFALCPDDLAGRITPSTRAIILNSPANPTGCITPPAVLRSLIRLAHRHNLWIISDECYEAFVYHGTHLSAARLDGSHVISLFSFSKTYAMTGLRVGYLLAPRPLADVCLNLHGAYVSCVSTPAQIAALAALEGPHTSVRDMQQTYARRRATASALLTEASVPHVTPHGAFYLFAHLANQPPTAHHEPDHDTWPERLLRRHQVAVAPGSAFGRTTPGWGRISLAVDDDQLTEALARLTTFSTHAHTGPKQAEPRSER
ncbi:pyridoxal phosphate-dependent aminotransferase [Streptomyces sp. NPDC101150]|uniref:pyridoxal phosphate-dependent aminotransferase n=1 Tax=Streptomyces sp. NPDC101150 TaxID=3366114 RepID=UPI0037F970B7